MHVELLLLDIALPGLATRSSRAGNRGVGILVIRMINSGIIIRRSTEQQVM
jgi:hypothetical protein